MIGDIVSYHGFKWVVSRQDMTSIPTGTWMLLRDEKSGLRIVLSTFGGWTLVKRPSFTEGYGVKYEGKPAVILEDQGDTVRLMFDRVMQHESGGNIEFNQIGADISKANLVLENLHKFENQE